MVNRGATEHVWSKCTILDSLFQCLSRLGSSTEEEELVALVWESAWTEGGDNSITFYWLIIRRSRNLRSRDSLHSARARLDLHVILVGSYNLDWLTSCGDSIRWRYVYHILGLRSSHHLLLSLHVSLGCFRLRDFQDVG